MKIKDLFHSNTGFSQSRIGAGGGRTAKEYVLYGQNELGKDLCRMQEEDSEKKVVTSYGELPVMEEGDLIFSTISGEAAIISAEHEGYVYTQNYARMVPTSKQVDLAYIAFLINESRDVKKQFHENLQGTQVIRYTLHMLKEIEIGTLPPLEQQRRIGKIYTNQLRIRLLQQRMARNEYLLMMHTLKGVNS